MPARYSLVQFAARITVGFVNLKLFNFHYVAVVCSIGNLFGGAVYCDAKGTRKCITFWAAWVNAGYSVAK